MRVGIYALARDSEEWVARWEESSREADVRVVTDTGSSDATVERLAERGVEVVRSRIMPWRWDVAHTQSLCNLPADVDLCIRLDMDEALVPGWRGVLESAAAGSPQFPTKIRHWYEWAPGIRFQLDRVHARSGYRYTGATHEGLVCWSGDESITSINDLLIVQAVRQREATRRDDDLALLETAVKESPGDARMRWYYARELDYAGRAAEAVEEYKRYLSLPGGWARERAFACRQLSLLEADQARVWLLRAFTESPEEPEAACRLAWDCMSKGDHAGAFYWSCFAIQARPESQSHASEASAYGPTPWKWASESAAAIGRYADAGKIARDGLRRFPGDVPLASLAAAYSFDTDGPER